MVRDLKTLFRIYASKPELSNVFSTIDGTVTKITPGTSGFNILIDSHWEMIAIGNVTMLNVMVGQIITKGWLVGWYIK